ncbi:MAG: helix-turn-helix transcriptional regulator [Planctomycetaceae bacterium]|nr:helix-turn-helix transcriptional regulator [Planctomycetaceae bacterium]
MKKHKRQTRPLTDVLKRHIEDCGMGFRELERATGVKRQSLMKFMAGESSLRLDVADKLADYFGLELRSRKRA